MEREHVERLQHAGVQIGTFNPVKWHSIEEISRALGLKVNAAKHSIFRAVKKMRIALEPFVPAD